MTEPTTEVPTALLERAAQLARGEELRAELTKYLPKPKPDPARELLLRLLTELGLKGFAFERCAPRFDVAVEVIREGMRLVRTPEIDEALARIGRVTPVDDAAYATLSALFRPALKGETT